MKRPSSHELLDTIRTGPCTAAEATRILDVSRTQLAKYVKQGLLRREEGAAPYSMAQVVTLGTIPKGQRGRSQRWRWQEPASFEMGRLEAVHRALDQARGRLSLLEEIQASLGRIIPDWYKTPLQMGRGLRIVLSLYYSWLQILNEFERSNDKLTTTEILDHAHYLFSLRPRQLRYLAQIEGGYLTAYRYCLWLLSQLEAEGKLDNDIPSRFAYHYVRQQTEKFRERILLENNL